MYTADSQNNFTRLLSDVRFGSITPPEAAEQTLAEVEGVRVGCDLNAIDVQSRVSSEHRLRVPKRPLTTIYHSFQTTPSLRTHPLAQSVRMTSWPPPPPP